MDTFTFHQASGCYLCVSADFSKPYLSWIVHHISASKVSHILCSKGEKDSPQHEQVLSDLIIFLQTLFLGCPHSSRHIFFKQEANSTFVFGSKIWVETKCWKALRYCVGEKCVSCLGPQCRRVVGGEEVQKKEGEVAGSTPGVETASSGQTCRQTLSSFHIVRNYKYPVAQQQLGSLTWRSSFRCF